MPHDESARPSSRRSSAPAQPDTPTSLSGDAWLDFHCELYDVVAELDLRVARIDPGVVRLVDGRSLGLLPLVEQCAARPRDDWRGLIERYLDGLVELLGGPAAAGSAIGSAALSSFDLRIRLVPATPIDAPVLESVGARQVTADLAAVLTAVDALGSRTVSADDVLALGWDLEETWSSAWTQTAMLDEPDELDAVEIGGVEIVHMFGSSDRTASLVCSLEQHIGPLGPDGAIVAVPCDHTVLIHPIEGGPSRRAIGTMVPIVRRLHADGPGSLSPQIYWWRRGELVWIPTVFGGETNEVYLPAGLSEALS